MNPRVWNLVGEERFRYVSEVVKLLLRFAHGLHHFQGVYSHMVDTMTYASLPALPMSVTQYDKGTVYERCLGALSAEREGEHE